MNLNNFKKEISSTMISRGHDYWQAGAVEELEQVNNERWTATVHGSELYNVSVDLEGDAIKSSECDCPYDWGSLCKHEVAVFFALRDHFNESKDKKGSDSSKQQKTKTPKKQTVEEKIETALASAEMNELTAFVKKYALKDRFFREQLLLSFEKNTNGPDKNHYKKVVQSSLNRAMDRHGFIDYRSSRMATQGADELLGQIESALDRSDQLNMAIEMCQAVIEEMVPAIQHADDSSGSIGGCIELAFDYLRKCIDKINDGKGRQALFEYCLNQAKSETYEGWDWQWSFFYLAADLIGDDSQEKRLFEAMEKVAEEQEGKFSHNYDRERMIEVMLEVIQKRKTDEEVNDFIANHLEVTSIRRRAIEKAFEEQDFEQVKHLAKQGIVQAKQDGYPGLEKNWLEWLLKVAELEGDQKEVRRYTLKLFLFRHEFDYYDKYKATFTSSEWKKELKKILVKLDAGDWVLGKIFIREEMWEDLLKMVGEKPSFSTLETYHSHLVEHFPQQLSEMYQKAAQDHLARHMGRGAYQEACRMLRRVKKISGAEVVDQLISHFRMEYKNRPALMEELDGV